MPKIQQICVFCGSRKGAKPLYAEAATRVGRAIAEHGLGLVYGGGGVGLMGIVADAVLAGGGTAVGVIPAHLSAKEIAHESLTELIIVPGMHERKALMASRSDAFLTIPGGVGTFEEFFEILTWAVLGLHHKPIAVLNLDGYFDPLIHLLDHAVGEGFFHQQHRDLVIVSDEPETIVANLASIDRRDDQSRVIDSSMI